MSRCCKDLRNLLVRRASLKKQRIFNSEMHSTCYLSEHFGGGQSKYFLPLIAVIGDGIWKTVMHGRKTFVVVDAVRGQVRS